MTRTYDKPISIQRINELTEDWETVFNVHAYINKAKSDSEYLKAGAIRGKRTLLFEIRYFTALDDISFNTQAYRVLYNGRPFNIEDYDDFMLKHNVVKILGVSY